MRVALYQPDIPQNTGTILRTCACLRVPVDIIGPAGFSLSDRALKRAGLDYLTTADLRLVESWDDFLAWRAATGSRLVLATTRAPTCYAESRFRPDDILLFGRESAGVPETVAAQADLAVRVPLASGARSLNVAVSVGMILGEALRQTNGFPRA